jgi:hypothetical protein
MDGKLVAVVEELLVAGDQERSSTDRETQKVVIVGIG